MHERDTDCTLDPETNVCRECGVFHGDPCPRCSGRGFHEPGCPEFGTTDEVFTRRGA